MAFPYGGGGHRLRRRVRWRTARTLQLPVQETTSTSGPITVAFPEPGKLRSRDIFRLLTRSWPFIRPYRRDLVRLFVAMLPGAATAVFGLLLIQIFFDVVGNGAPLSAYQARLLRLPLDASRHAVLVRSCLAAGVITLIGLPINFFVSGYAIWILQKISNLFRVNLYTQLQELSLSFHSEEKIGDAIFRMFQDSAAIPQVINGLLMAPIQWLPLAVVNLGWLAVFNYAMALIALALIPADFALAWMFSGALRGRFLRAREASALATSRVEETLASIKAVKGFGREDHEAAVYADDNWRAFLAARRARMLLVIYRVLANLLRALAYLAVVYIGARQVISGARGGFGAAVMSLGLFQGAVVAFSRMSAGSHHLTVLWGSLQDVGVGLARVFEMLGKRSERTLATVPVLSGREIPKAPSRALVFERVTFGYARGVAVLTDIDFAARAGEMTAIAGPSGAGKSTLISLLLRFFDPLSGRILLDGRDIREFELAAWRGLISVVLQENPLFTATLRDNIAYGRPGASSGEIRAAAELARLGGFVDSLPAGLDTMLGEKGAKLSTGQAQRIGLARALLRDAPILLLDEPTSALDLATEDQVMHGVRAWIAERPGGRLAVMMTHRRTAAAWADRTYRIAAGRLSDQSLQEPGVAQGGNG